jgi:hypothetical protein
MNKLFKILLVLSISFLSVQGSIWSDKKNEAKKTVNTQMHEFISSITPLKGLAPAQWRVIWTGDASTEATISWSTADKGEKHILHYDEINHANKILKYKHHMECQKNGQFTLFKKEIKDVKPAFYHHASIKDLKPNTKYYFILESDGHLSKPFYFITAPKDGTDFSVIHGGDSRSGHLTRCKMNRVISELVESNKKIIAFIHGGDYIVSGKFWKQWRLWLSHHELTTCADGRVLPIIPARGNHDGGPIYKEVFNIEPTQPDWHTTTIGKEIAVVTLDTNVSGGGAQSQWLEAELKRLRPQTKWLLTQYHRPLYPAVKKAPAHTKIFCPLFDKYNVDLACEADGHCIKRTIPIRAGKADPTGVTYIGEGGLGVGQRKPKTDHWYLQGGAVGYEHHVMVLDFSDVDLRIRTILMDKKVFDDHRIKIRN